jgi:hypothetical protein
MNNPQGNKPPLAVVKPRIQVHGLKKERLDKPPRFLFFGEGKVGKSTLCASMPEPVFVGAEDGTSELVTRRIPTPPGGWTWEDILQVPLVLAETPDLPYKTLVVDSVDWAEPLCWDYLCRVNRWTKGIESPGYGKGYTAATEEWWKFLRNLDILREKRGYMIALIGHAIVKAFPNPDGESYDRYIIKMHEKSAGKIREWVDAVGFIRVQILTNKLEEGRSNRVIGVTSGKRMIHMQNGATFEAGNRFDIRAPLELPPPPVGWEIIWNAIVESRPTRRRELIEQALAELIELDPEVGKVVTERARAMVVEAGDESQPLGDILVGLQNKIQAVKEEKEKASS